MLNLENTLKSNKMRLTEARKVLYEVLSKSESALSAREICDQLKLLKVAKSDPVSVYRNLAVFTQMGLTHNLSNGKYVVCKNEHKQTCHKHTHVIVNCNECGEIKEVAASSKYVDQLINSIPGIKLLSTLTLQGKCEKCYENQLDS